MEDVKEYVRRKTDTDILAKTHAFKVSALARGLAYTYAKKEKGVSYPYALKIIEGELARLHSKVKAERRK